MKQMVKHDGVIMTHTTILVLLTTLSFFIAIPMPSCAANVARIPPGDVLERAAKSWETIYDYQAILNQVERHPNGDIKEFWVRATLIGGKIKDATVNPTFLLELYDQPITLEQKSREDVSNALEYTPTKVYYSNRSRILYTYDPKANTLTLEGLDNHGPLPEFLQLAGFLELDVEELKEKGYLDDEVLEETVGNSSTYKVSYIPRKKLRDVEPVRSVWIDRKTNLPVRLEVLGDISIRVDFTEYRINRQLRAEDIEPQVPDNVYINDLTR